MLKNLSALQETGVQSLGRKTWQPTLVFLLGNPMDRGAWWATIHGVAAEFDTTERLNSSNNKMQNILSI